MLTALLIIGALALAGQTSPVAPAGDAQNGRKLFVIDGCASCHGLEGQGAPTSGPRIGPNPLPLAAFIKYIRSPKNQMPPYTSKVLSDRELTDIHAFLAARPNAAAAAVLAP